MNREDIVTHPSDLGLRFSRRRALVALAIPAVFAVMPTLAQAAPIDTTSAAAGSNRSRKSNTGSGSISSYKIAANGTLSLIGSTVLKGSSFAALDLRVDPSGKTLYVVENAAKAVAALTVNAGGTLTELSGSPFALPATSSFPFGVAIT